MNASTSAKGTAQPTSQDSFPALATASQTSKSSKTRSTPQEPKSKPHPKEDELQSASSLINRLITMNLERRVDETRM